MILFMPYIYFESTMLIGRVIDFLTIYSENAVVSKSFILSNNF